MPLKSEKSIIDTFELTVINSVDAVILKSDIDNLLKNVLLTLLIEPLLPMV